MCFVFSHFYNFLRDHKSCLIWVYYLLHDKKGYCNELLHTFGVKYITQPNKSFHFNPLSGRLFSKNPPF